MIASTVPVKGFQGYFISDDGIVYSERKGARKILSAGKTLAGYYIVALNINGDQSMRYVHRLVAESFIYNHDSKRTVNHKNGIKTDNRVENLEWATHGENNLHAYRTLGKKGAHTGLTGFSHHRSKAVVKLSMDGAVLKVYGSASLASKDVGGSQGNISSACRGEFTQSCGFKWRFATPEEINKQQEKELCQEQTC